METNPKIVLIQLENQNSGYLDKKNSRKRLFFNVFGCFNSTT